MAKTNNTPPSPESDKKNGLMGKIEWISLICIILLVGYIALNMNGIKMVDTSESVEITNNLRKSQDWDQFKKKKDKQLAEKRAQTEKAGSFLHSFVEDYRKTGDRDLKKTDIKFLEKMDDKIQRNGTIDNAQNYYNFMKHSFQFYKTMKNFSNTTSKGASSISRPSKEEANGYIQKLFSVEQEKLEIFTEEDPNTEEWIEFLNEE